MYSSVATYFKELLGLHYRFVAYVKEFFRLYSSVAAYFKEAGGLYYSVVTLIKEFWGLHYPFVAS